MHLQNHVSKAKKLALSASSMETKVAKWNRVYFFVLMED